MGFDVSAAIVFAVTPRQARRGYVCLRDKSNVLWRAR
jgi:hypothetical protein